MQDRRLRVDYTLWIVNMIVISYHYLTRQATVQRVYEFLQFDRPGGEIISLKNNQTPFYLPAFFVYKNHSIYLLLSVSMRPARSDDRILQ